jgi:hypothetical protein
VLATNDQIRKILRVLRWTLGMPITLETTINRSGETLYAPVGTEEAVLMSVAAGCYYGLNAVASRTWELLAGPKTIRDICAQLSEEFEVDAQTCEAEVLSFVQDLIDNGLVQDAEAQA